MARLSGYVKKKLYSYFRVKLHAVNYRRGWMQAKCPFCGRDSKFGIHLGQNRTNCFRCGETPQPVALVMDLEKLDTYNDFLDYLDKQEFFSYDYKEVSEDVHLAEHIEFNMPQGYKLYGGLIETELDKIAHNYAKKRGFNITELRRMGWGYCETDEDGLFGYMIIPFFEKGKLVYYNARRIFGSGPRYKNPKVEETGLGKNFLIYNKEALYLFKKVILCEGAINAHTLGETAISSGGKAVSRHQINEILKSPVERVVILLDSDAKLKAIEIALSLIELKRVKVVILPDGKDPNDLGRSITNKYIRETPYTSYQELIILKNQISYNERTKHTYKGDSVQKTTDRVWRFD